MIKSSKLTTKFANTEKKKQLSLFIDEYNKVVKFFIDVLWKEQDPPKFIPKEITSQSQTWLSARAVQCASKQASGIIRGTRSKQKRRVYIYNKLLKENKTKQAEKLKKIIDAQRISKPNLNSLCPELDSRFISISWGSETSFDGWITLSSFGNKLKIKLPVKKTKHFNKLNSLGTIKPGIRLNKNFLTFNFEIPESEKKTVGKVVGLDIGIKNVFTLSTGNTSKRDIHGHTLDSINKKLARKTKGSKTFGRAQEHRKNYVNWTLNQIDLSEIKTLKLENIKHLRKHKRTSRYLSHFTYTEIYDNLESLALLNGVRIERVDPSYTSQRCNKCGWVQGSNRKGKMFRCRKCGYAQDADLNAAMNIALTLQNVSKEEMLLHKKGFYIYEVGKEPIVPFEQKPK